ncbi:MAG: hypothetical protein ACR2MD_06485 [Aridibacter sp.]
MLNKRIYLLFSLCLVIFLYGCSSIDEPKQFHFLASASADKSFIENNKLEEALRDLNPQDGDSGLLLAFDTDTGQDRQSYTQFYDSNKEFTEKNATNKTIYLTRKDDEIKLAAKLNFVASPQNDGFLYLGLARYFEVKPRDKNEHLDNLENNESYEGFKNFGFDYTRIWKTNDNTQISQAKKAIIKKTKRKIDSEYKKLNSEDREYHRNITDYEKISFISDGFYITDGFWSQIRGGASWFDAHTKFEVVSLCKRNISNRLKDYYSEKDIVKSFQKTFGKTRSGSDDAKYNDMDSFWQSWKDRLEGKYDIIPTFTLERHLAETHLTGLVLIDGNNYRSFHAESDFGKAPKALISYDNPKIDFDKFKQIYPKLLDVFVSPNQNTVFVLTDKKIIGIDVETKKEIYSQDHNLEFNKVIMVEWAVNDYVEEWESELNSNN